MRERLPERAWLAGSRFTYTAWGSVGNAADWCERFLTLRVKTRKRGWRECSCANRPPPGLFALRAKCSASRGNLPPPGRFSWCFAPALPIPLFLAFLKRFALKKCSREGDFYKFLKTAFLKTADFSVCFLADEKSRVSTAH